MAVVLLTGATGFVGGTLARRLSDDGKHSLVLACRRRLNDSSFANNTTKVVGDIGPETDWAEPLNGVEVVVHAAARAHFINDPASDPLAEFRKINTEATLNLARQAAAAGVRRFVFISSIGVNGNQNTHPFTENDLPCPSEPYAVSKHEAEQGLGKIAEETGMEVVIIRPPLVYGPAAPGNFGSLLKWVAKGVPLPLGAVVHNKRSLVALDNLVDFIITCIDHPAAANQTFLVADGEDLSTTELLRRVGQAMGKPVRLIPVPMWLLQAGARLLGKQAMARRLCGSLQVDITKARTMLGWNPPVSVDEGLRRAVAGG